MKRKYGVVLLATLIFWALRPVVQANEVVVNFDQGFDLKGVITQAGENVTAPVVDLAKVSVELPVQDEASAENVRELVHYISVHSTYNNNFDEDVALRNLLQVGRITGIQFRLLKMIFSNASYNNGFSEDAAFYNVLARPGITAEHEMILAALIRGCSSNNDFNEDLAFRAVIDTPTISPSTAGQLIDVFHNAQYNNNLNDTRLFLEVLRSAI